MFAVTTRLPVFTPSETPSRFAVVAKPVPTVNVTPSARVTFPRLIAPVAVPPRTDVAVTETGVPASPKVMTEAAVFAAIVPAMLTALGAVAVTPAVKVVESPAASPIVTVPVLSKAVVPAIVFNAPVSATLYAFTVPVTVRLVPTVKPPVKLIAAPPVVSEINTVVAFTVEPKVTPEVLSVIVNAPAVPDPNAPIVARPPASRRVRPPDKSAIVPMLMVAPAVEPESNVRLFPPLVTVPTFNTPTAELPVSNVVAAVRVTAPRSI